MYNEGIMKKPSPRVFWTGYVIVWIAIDVYMASLIPERPLLGASAGNIIMVFINLIGTIFAIGGWVPWREDDRCT
jgi:hypothetical protein